MTDNVLTLAPGKSDHDRAQDLKEALAEASKPLLAVLNEATKDGFLINVQFGSVPPLGQIGIQQLIVSKHF